MVFSRKSVILASPPETRGERARCRLKHARRQKGHRPDVENMKPHSPDLFKKLSCGLLLAALAGAAAAEAAGDPTPPRPSIVRPVRRVHVHRVWCEPGKAPENEAVMTLCAGVDALGLRWRSLLVEARLRTADGKPVPVAAEAPAGYADQQGRFLMSSRAPILDDRFEWDSLRASFPYRKVLDLRDDEPRRLIATLAASSGGLSSVSEAEITVPPQPAPGVTRAVRLLAVDVLANSMPPSEAGGRADAKTATGVAPAAAKELGLTVWGYVEAVGLDRQKIVGRLSFRREDGQPLLQNDREDGTETPFVSQTELNVVGDQAQVFCHFVPYRAIGLQPGHHRLILTYSASSAGLRATTEQECIVHVAGAEDDGPAEREVLKSAPAQP
jgi:hypothetical protein